MTRLVSFVVLIILVLALGYLFLTVMVGFFLPIFLALVLTILFYPLQVKLTAALRGHERIAAGIMTVLIMAIVIAPIAFVIYRAAVDAIGFFKTNGGQMFDSQQFGRLIDEINSRFQLSFSADELIKNMGEQAKAWFEPLAAKTPGFLGGWLINTIVLVFGLYYFLVDGPDMVGSTSRMLPLDSRYQRQLTEQFVSITRAVVTATVVTAMTQGIGMGIGYYFAGLTPLMLLIMLTLFGAFVPAVGSAIIWVPACLWLLFTGHVSAAIALFIWCAAVATVADNIVRPALLHGQSNIHPLMALLSVIGGVEVLGPVGLFVGPMAVAFLQTGLKLLNVEIEQLKRTESVVPPPS